MSGMRPNTDLTLAQVAARAGFADQCQFCHHFRRLFGVTPRQFRMSARIAQETAIPFKRLQIDPLTIPHEWVFPTGAAVRCPGTLLRA
jgi:hypothetical protein